MLLRLLWLDPASDPLRAIVRSPAGYALFFQMLDELSKRDKVNLVFWEQVQTVKAVKDAAKRKSEALKLHSTHWAIAQGAQPFPVDGGEAEGLLDAKARLLNCLSLHLSRFHA